MKPNSYILILCMIFASCRNGMEKEVGTTSYKSINVDKEHFVLLSPDGDTIPAGVPIPAKGRRIDPDSVAKPEVVPFKGAAEAIPTHTNVHPAGTPKVVPIPEELTVITPGEDGVPIPKTIPVEGKAVPAVRRKPTRALLPQYMDKAIYDIQYLDVDQGLHSSNVYVIMEDSRGNIWFGTEKTGVSRYDGKYFTKFSTEEGLSGNYILNIIEDSKGNIWFGTFDRGVSCYDGHHFTHYTTEEGLPGNSIRGLLEDKHGNIWFGINRGGVVRFDGHGFILFTSEEGLINDIVQNLYEDSHGNIWIATSRGVVRYDPDANSSWGTFTHFTTKEGLNFHSIISILEDHSGNLWFGTFDQGVNRYDPEANEGRGTFTYITYYEGLTSNLARMWEDSQGYIWFATPYGVNLYDPDAYGGRGSFTHFTIEEGLSHNYVGAVLEDSQGNIWMGTIMGGVNRYNRHSFTHFTTEEGLSTDQLYTIVEDTLGRMWIGTFLHGVNLYDPKANDGRGDLTPITKENGLSGTAVTSAMRDSKGNIWLGCSGIDRFDGQSFTHFRKEQGVSDNTVLSMLEDSKGNFWFGTKRNGLNYFNGNSFTQFTTKEGLNDKIILSMLEDGRGHLWFGTSNGLGLYEPPSDGREAQGHFHYFTTSEGLSHNHVQSMLEDSRGQLWFGTKKGLNLYFPDSTSTFNRNSLVYFTAGDGLNSNEISTIIEDKEKRIWVSTDRGINVLVPSPGASSIGRVSEAADYQIFPLGKEDGLKRVDHEIRGVYLDSRDHLWWASREGLIELDLDQFKVPTELPKIALDHIELKQQFIDYRRLADTSYNNTFSFGGAISHSFDSVAPYYNYPLRMELPHYLNHLTFYFSAIDWAAPHKIRYSYRLEGLDKNWSIIQSEPFADYRNLPHGTFTLKVKAIGAAQLWSEPFEYTFTIRPPWWLTWWAYALYVLAAISLLYALYRFQLNRRLQLAEAHRLRELDEVKTRLYTNITHEFRTPLTIISGMAVQVLENPESWFREGLQMIQRNSNRLLNLVNQLLDLRKLEAGTLPIRMIQGDIISYLRYLSESFHSYAESKTIQLDFEPKQEELIMDYDPEKITAIVSNLLSNAIKFTPEGGKVKLEVGALDAELVRRLDSSSGASLSDFPLPTSDFLQLTIADSGIGIPPEKLPHIFDRFYQADDASTRKAEGTGIGLALTKELVKLLGGEIQVESREGQGTTFSVFLPITRNAPIAEAMENKEMADQLITAPFVSTASPENIGERLSSSSHQELTPQIPSVLLIEDNPDVVQYLSACLEGRYTLEVAYNGQQGVDKALEIVPDLVISDVMMPEMDGFEVCHTLKRDTRTSHIPVILLTARADIDSRLEGLERGADAYLPKPFNKEELLIRIRKLLELREKLQARYLALAVGQTGVATEKDSSPSTEKQEDEFVLKARSIIENHLDDVSFSLEGFCRELAMSRSQAHRKLTALTGYAPSQFIRYVRLSKAKVLLLDPERTISEVAYATGFADPGYFTRVFKKEFGVTPSEYVERKQKGN